MTNWWPGIIALFVGLVAGIIALSRLRAPATVPDDDEAAKLAAKAQALVAQLKELDADKHQYDAEAYAREKARLEAEAVAAMKARDAAKAQKKAPKQSKKPIERPPPKHPQLLGALWGGGTVAFIAFAYFMVTGAGEPQKMTPVASANDPRYEAMLVLSAIAISFQDSEQLLQAWEIYMRQQVPRRRPPQLQRAVDWLEKVTNDLPEKQ